MERLKPYETRINASRESLSTKPARGILDCSAATEKLPEDKTEVTLSEESGTSDEKVSVGDPNLSTSLSDTKPATAPDRKKRMLVKTAFSILAEQWFLVALGILIAIASQVQVPLAHQQVKRTITSYLCVSLIFFVTGCILNTKTLLQNYGRWKIHLFVQLQCFIMTSALVFGLVSAVATNHHFMDPGLLVGLVFMGCVATTISSNVVMTRQAHGNQALTVVQTTVGNFLGVFVTPALVVMYTSVPTWYNAVLPPLSGHWSAIYRRTLMKLGLSIYVPLVIGQIVHYVFPKQCKTIFIDWNLNKIGSISLLVILWSTYDQAFASHAFASVPADDKIFIVFISIALWLVFFGVAFFTSIIWLPREDVVAVCYCVPAKGITMAVPLSTTVFAGLSLDVESKIQIPIVIYQGLQLAFGSILVPTFRRWVDARKEAEEKKQEADSSHSVVEEQSDKRDSRRKIEEV